MRLLLAQNSMKLPVITVFLWCTLGNAKFLNSGLESNTTLRLAGGKSVTTGRLELYADGTWKGICSSNFTSASAQVACRQMGFVGGKIDVHLASAADHHPSSASSMAIDVACSGSEADLLACATVSDATISGSVDRCMDRTPVALTCSQDIEAVIGVRLGDSYVPGSGRLEVYSGNSWGTVCRNGFNEASARVACRQLGLHDGSLDNRTLTGFLPVAMAALMCDGTEMRLQDCRLHLQLQQQPTAAAAAADKDCNNLETVGIVCSPDSSLLETIAILPHKSPSKIELNVAGLNGIFFFEAPGCVDLTLFLYYSINGRPSNYLKIDLFLHDSLALTSTSTSKDAVPANVVWECKTEDQCTEISNVGHSSSSVSSFSSCHSYRPLVLLWRKGAGAVVVPRSNLLGTGPEELEAAVQTLLQSDDQVVGWKTTSILPEDKDFSRVSLGSGRYELAVRIYRNSSWFVNRCLLREIEIADAQLCGSNAISKTLCLQCGCCFNPSIIPRCYFSKAFDIPVSSSCIVKKFNDIFGRIIFLSDSEEIYRNDDLTTIVLLERTLSTAIVEIQYNDESLSDVIKMTDLISDDSSPLPVWTNTKLQNDSTVLKFYRIIRQHTYSRTGEYHVMLSITDPGNPEERILRNIVVFVVPRPPIPGYFRSIFFVNSGPVKRSQEVQLALIYQNTTVTPEFIVTVDMSDGTVLSLNFDPNSPIDNWILNATGLESAVALTYQRGLISHQFKNAGIFTAEATITSSKWSFPWEAFHVRTAVVVTCSALEVDLKNLGSSRNKIQAYPINKVVTASLVLLHGCQASLDTGSRNVEWSVYPLKNLTSTKNESTRIRIPPSDSNPEELKIPPYTLEPGFYIVEAQVLITLDDSDKAAFADPKEGPLNYTIEGWIAIYIPTASKFRERKALAASINETILVDMSRDSPVLRLLQVTTKPVYRWACMERLATLDEIEGIVVQLKFNQHLVDVCFRPNRLPSGLSSQVLAFEADQLSFVSLPATFTFVWLAGDRKLETVVWGSRFVTVANDTRVIIDIVCHSNCDQQAVAADDREVILEVICARESCEPGAPLGYEWEVHAIDVSRYNEHPVQVLSRLDRPKLILNTTTLHRDGGGYIYSILVTVTKLRTGVFGSRLYRLLVDRQMALINGAVSWPRTIYYSKAFVLGLLVLCSQLTS